MFGHDGQVDAPPYANVRLHRDGAAGIARQLDTDLFPMTTARILNAQLAYLCWFWADRQLRRPVEINIESPRSGRAASTWAARPCRTNRPFADPHVPAGRP